MDPLLLEQLLLQEVAGNQFANEQALAELNSQFNNPFTSPGGFATNQVLFNDATSTFTAQAAWNLALLTPNDQPLPFNAITNSMAISGAFNAGIDLNNTLLTNAEIRDFATGQIAGQIGGVGSFFLPDGSFVGDFSTAPAFQYYDPFGQQVFPSDVPLADPNLLLLQPAFGF